MDVESAIRRVRPELLISRDHLRKIGVWVAQGEDRERKAIDLPTQRWQEYEGVIVDHPRKQIHQAMEVAYRKINLVAASFGGQSRLRYADVHAALAADAIDAITAALEEMDGGRQSPNDRRS